MPDANAKSVAYVEALEASGASIVVHLSKSPIDPLADTLLLSAITEATFGGYAPVDLEFEPCEVPNDEWAEVASQEVVFEAGLLLDNEVVYFAYCVHTPPNGVPKIVGIYEFPEPVNVEAPLQQIGTGAWRFRLSD